MIVLYAAVVLSSLIAGVGITVRVLASGSFDLVPIQIIKLIGICVSIAAFTYGLISAISGTLSPKRMVAVLIIAIYFLVLYQTYSLYKKRVAAEFAQVSVMQVDRRKWSVALKWL